jgi:transcriptional regulator GlxA family with amidase domain
MRVVMVVYPGVQVLDVTGPLEVFANANRRLDQQGDRRAPRYQIEIVARESGPVLTTSGIELSAQRGLREIRGPIDTLLVAGGDGSAEALRDRLVIRFLQRGAERARRVASVCTGAFLLAEAGLLDGRRATTHWASCAKLAALYPKIEVESDPIFVRDGKYWSSAGVCAGMDLALALVEQDHGRELALTVARWLVLFLKRPGGQSQFSAELSAQATEHDAIRGLQAWAQRHLDTALGVELLAKRVAMSPRNFARVFAREVGETPARWVDRVRVEAARRLLEESVAGMDEITHRCGFGSAESLRRAFLRRVRVSPAAYRARFRSAAA